MRREKKVFAICDLEEAYVVHLAHYLNQKSDLPFRVMAFTGLDSLIAYAGAHEIEILLISTDAMTDEVRSLNVHRIIILSDGEEPMLDSDDPSIDKYQDSDTIARLVCRYAGAACDEEMDSLGSCVLIGVYSPVARCGKTLFSLTLSQLLARSGKTLYLNMESWSGLEGLLQTNWREDLADLMYTARSQRDSLNIRLEEAVKSFGTLDVCPPSFFPEDLRDVEVSQWVQFFAALAQAGGYQTILLDIGDQIKDIPHLLGLCGKVFLPMLPDPVSRSKITQFDKTLEAMSMEDLKHRLIRLYLPSVHVRSLGPSFLNDLLYGDMGQFVRQLQNEEQMHR